MRHLCILFTITCILAGCGAQPIPITPTPTPDTSPSNDLMTEWHQLAKSEYATINFDRAMIIANDLALQGPNGLDPLFKVIESQEETPAAKMLAVASLGAHIQDKDVPRLIALTDSKYDQSTRGC